MIGNPYSFGRLWHFDYILPVGLYESLIVQMRELGAELGMAFDQGQSITIVSWDGNDAILHCKKSPNSEYLNELELIVWARQWYNFIRSISNFITCLFSSTSVKQISTLINIIIEKCSNAHSKNRVVCVCTTCQRAFRDWEHYHNYPLTDSDSFDKKPSLANSIKNQ